MPARPSVFHPQVTAALRRFPQRKDYSGNIRTGAGEGSTIELGIGPMDGSGEGFGVRPGVGKGVGTGWGLGVMVGFGIGVVAGELSKGEAGSVNPPEDGGGKRSTAVGFVAGSPPPHPARKKHPAVTIFQCAPMTRSICSIKPPTGQMTGNTCNALVSSLPASLVGVVFGGKAPLRANLCEKSSRHLPTMCKLLHAGPKKNVCQGIPGLRRVSEACF